MATYFLIAGEASGDTHAAALMEQIKNRDPEAIFAGLGGDKMCAAGCRLYRHIKHMAFMGFVAVVRHWQEVRDNFRIAQEALLKEQPDVLVLIDYPSFNLRMAQFVRKHLPQTKIVYYIPPKVWAWKRRRIHTIARLCDKVLGIFPFEPTFYSEYGYHCEYVGNPVVEETARTDFKTAVTPTNPTIVLLPGSRPSEITHCLPRMLEAARRFPDYSITICAAPGIDDSLYTPYLRVGETLVHDTHMMVRKASVAVVNSGTATLETALLGCPQVAVYHIACSWTLGFVRRWMQPLLFTIPYFTPVNIISGKEVIKECVANDFTVDKVSTELERLLHDEAYKKEMLASYDHLSSLLGPKSASSIAAAIITRRP